MNERTTSSAGTRESRGADYGLTEGGAPSPGAREASVPADAGRQMQEMQEVAKQIQDKVSQVIEEAPYVVPLAMGGVGFLAGALFSSKLTRVMFMVAGGYALNEFVRAGGLGKLEKLAEKAIDKV